MSTVPRRTSLGRRVPPKAFLRRNVYGEFADLQAYRRSATIATRRDSIGTSLRPTQRAGYCALCIKWIQPPSMTALDGRTFHLVCANQLLRGETVVLRTCAYLARERAIAIMEHTAGLVREARRLRGSRFSTSLLA
jgi:hypothetical protein